MRKGYTVIELLAVVSILVIISGVIAGILYASLRGSTKTRVNTEVSQNGNLAISRISSEIVNSTNVVALNNIEISDCTQSVVPEGTPITSITLKKLDGEEKTFACEDATIKLDGSSMISGSVRVTENTCFFSCQQLSNDPYAIPIIHIEFGLESAGGASSESQSAATFKTAITLSNYAP